MSPALGRLGLAFIAVVFALIYLPIALVVLTSLDASTITTLPVDDYSLKWYRALFSNTKTIAALATSVELGLLSAAAATTIGLLAALAVTRGEFVGRRLFLGLLTLPMIAPGVVLGVALLLAARFVGFKTGFFALFLGHTVLALPYCAFIVIASLAKLDRTIEDAARGLGAAEPMVLWRVTLPNIMPGLFGALLFGFTISIGEFVVSFFLTSAGTTTLPIRIYSIVKTGITPEINAVSTLILVATLLLTLAAMRLTLIRKPHEIAKGGEHP
jgi:ABC-type spermidine/putrescine transport system permease subunit II